MVITFLPTCIKTVFMSTIIPTIDAISMTRGMTLVYYYNIFDLSD